MKKIVLSLAIVGLTNLAFGQQIGIKFEDTLSWKEIKAKAKRENKFIFMDAFATWCGPCKKMDKDVYASEKVGSYMNDKFISLKVQMDRTSADNEFIKNWYNDASKIRIEFDINVFPTLIFFAPNGNMIRRIGFTDQNGFIEQASTALKLSLEYNANITNYKSGKMSPDEIGRMALVAKDAGDLHVAQKIADDHINNYLFKLADSVLYRKENLEFIGNFIASIESRSYVFFSKNRDKINNVLGDYAAQKSIMNFINKKYQPEYSTWATTKPNWDKIEKNITKKFGTLGQETVWGTRMMFHLVSRDDWELFSKYYMLYFKLALNHSLYDMNNFSWPIFEHIDDPKVLNFACDTVMKYALEKFDANDYKTYDTYANLLYKTGRIQEALKWEERAAKISGNDKSIVETLEKMKAGEPTWPLTSNNK